MAPRRPAAPRTYSEQCRLVRQTRLSHAEADESTSRFQGGAHRHGENNWNPGRRSLPHYASERFDRWFSRHCRASVSDATNKEGRSPDRPGGYKPPLLGKRGRVILWDDTFVRYHEPHIGMAAVKVLEALGFEVALVKNRRCCGRPAFSQGNLDAAAKLAKHNVS